MQYMKPADTRDAIRTCQVEIEDACPVDAVIGFLSDLAREVLTSNPAARAAWVCGRLAMEWNDEAARNDERDTADPTRTPKTIYDVSAPALLERTLADIEEAKREDEEEERAAQEDQIEWERSMGLRDDSPAIERQPLPSEY